MSKQSDPGRRPARLMALLAVIATLGAVLAFSLGSLAQADTTGTPDPVTKAVINPGATCPNFTNTTPAAPPCATATNGQDPATTLTGAAEGTVVSIHVDLQALPGKLNAVVARLCRSNISVNTTAQMSPSLSGNCIAQPFVSGTDFASASADTDNGDNTNADFIFKVGTGTETNHQGPGTAITCDANNPCSIWLDEQVDNQTVNSSGHVFKHYDVTYAPVTPGAPTVHVTASDVTLTVDLGPPPPAPAGNPQFDHYNVSISPADAAAQSGPSTQTHYVFSSVKDFTQYTVSATASSSGTNGSTSSPGTATGTPTPPAPTGVTGTAGDRSVLVSWTAPATITGSPTPATYEVHATPCVTGTSTAPCPTGTQPGTVISQTTTSNATSWNFTGLTNGTAYFFTVAANYTTPVAGQGPFSAASAPVAPVSAKLTQTLTVTRPQGALVMTQLCTTYPARSSAATGGTQLFAGQASDQPRYTGSAVPNGGTVAGPQPDPQRPNYPYPTDQFGNPAANYPTDCQIDLGVAHLMSNGQFFEATGVMDTVTVVETNSGDPGFSVSGQIPSFNDGSGHSFSGSELGLTPKVSSESQGFTDSDGNPYQMNVLPRNTASCPTLQGASPTACTGQAVPPNSPNATGLSNLTQLASASSGHSLGIATLDGNLDLYIPINKIAGTYTGVLSITAL